MTNQQVRLIASAIALLAGGIIASSAIHVNVGIVIVLISGAMFAVEYLRCQKP